ncbi:MAG: hypothetical protein ACRD0G_02975 [Acidimicrobiales bacterium]
MLGLFWGYDPGKDPTLGLVATTMPERLDGSGDQLALVGLGEQIQHVDEHDGIPGRGRAGR